MPIYSYECAHCGEVVEEYRTLAHRLIATSCQECGSDATFTLSISERRGPSYPYMEENFEHKPVQINSLKHYYAEQKKRGLVDGGRPRGVKGQWM